jgi:hypothetical protein
VASTDLGRAHQRVRDGSLKPLVSHYGGVLEPDRALPHITLADTARNGRVRGTFPSIQSRTRRSRHEYPRLAAAMALYNR